MRVKYVSFNSFKLNPDDFTFYVLNMDFLTNGIIKSCETHTQITTQTLLYT